MDRCEKVVTEEEDNFKDRETMSEALNVCGYPQWTIISVKEKMAKQESKKKVKVEEKERNRGG